MIIRDVVSRAVFSDRKMGKAELLRGDRIFAGLNCFEPGQTHTLHTHAGQDKLYLVLDGEGDITVGTEVSCVGPGDLVLAEGGVAHAVENRGTERLVVMTVMAPPPGAK